jgi:predicted transcriptional regulator
LCLVSQISAIDTDISEVEIVSKESESVRRLIGTVDCDYRGVRRNLIQLESLGVIEFEDNGFSKNPILRGRPDNIDFSIRLPQLSEHREEPGTPTWSTRL